MWKGPAYRSFSGHQQDAETTAGDVVRYEQEELGNNLGLTSDQITYLDQYPASLIVWVGRTRGSVLRYGYPQKYNLGDNANIIAEDEEGGYLVFNCNK